MRRAFPCRRDAGTSLVEALVAMAVMAFGMLAIVGIQATLRLNADVAKQRSEGVRIAQDAMETARSFSTIATAVGASPPPSYDAIINTSSVIDTGNTSFQLSRTVVARTAPDRKEIAVRVDWTDRSGELQRVELLSVIGANDPAASLALGARPNGIPERQPMGRNPAIPPQSVSVGGGLSGFKPPGPSGGNVVWVFNDLSGIIVGVCNGVSTAQNLLTAADVASCSNNTTAQPLSGFVRFATALVQPTAAVAENPVSTALNLEVRVTLSSSGHPTPDHSCFAAAPTSMTTASTAVPYYCAIFSNTARVWSGIAELVPRAFTDVGAPSVWQIATNAADLASARFRVCRYTPASNDAQAVPNRQHPRQYTNVTALEPLADQNFLVILAGNDTLAFTCPTDVAPNPAAGDFVNSNTLVHQPAP